MTSLTPTIEFLRRHAPFGEMAPAHLEYLAKRLRLGFYAKNEVVISPEQGPSQRFYIIKQGCIRGESGAGLRNESAWELSPGECFPVGALLSRRPVRLTQRAVEDTFCFELEREDFEHLLHKSLVFHDFCTRRIANLLDNALRGIHANTAAASADTSLSTPLRTLIRRAPVVCAPDTVLGDALAAMDREHVGSIVVVDDKERPLGIFTLHDVLTRVVLPRCPLATPIHEVMTPAPMALAPTALAAEAALHIAQHGVGHLCVVENTRLVGVLSERDLFSLQRVGLVSLSRAIASAPSIDLLAQLETDVHKLIEQMLAQGASVGQLTQIITALNDSITRRVIELVLAQRGTPSVPFTWLAFGSEGRFEQTLRTDQDNGILFSVPADRTADDVRAELLPLAKRINEALAACGFPLCTGNVMASNPECCLGFPEWQARFSRWIDQGTPEHLLKATIYFDFRPLYGDTGPADMLKTWMLDQVANNKRFLHQLAHNALQNRPPLGLIRDFHLSSGDEHPHTLDLKLQGLAPFVDAARLIALAHRIPDTGTVARLAQAAQAQVISQGDADAWTDAYHFIQLLRMRLHRHQAEQGLALENRLDPDTLNDLDRRILKEAFRQARKLQTALAMDYPQ